ncbi:MAG: hypothetical protein ABI474_10005 [Actinomycetota bacterium]
MLGSVVGEAVGGAVVAGGEAEVLEDGASGLASAQPASTNEPNTIELSANEATTNDAAEGTDVRAVRSALRAALRVAVPAKMRAAVRAAMLAAGLFVIDALCPI